MENNVVQRWTEVFYGRHNNLADGLPRHEEGKCFVSPETLGEEYKWGLGEEKVQHGKKFDGRISVLNFFCHLIVEFFSEDHPGVCIQGRER